MTTARTEEVTNVYVHKQDVDLDKIVDKTFGMFLRDLLLKNYADLTIASVITMINENRLRDIISGNHKGITAEELEMVCIATGFSEVEMKNKACNGASEYYI